ncbi:MAG: hypothetical protein JXB49_35005 [Bacteroidales bacterium]|nr:hypothetical protein [Bacteroidales bacterium]
MDKNSAYAFEQGDTLIYKGSSLTDTFYVASIEKGFRSVDKTVEIEQVTIHIPELTKNCNDSTYDYCLGIHILRDAEKYTSIDFRNDFSSLVESFPLVSYKIGMTLVNNVYAINFRVPNKINPKDVKMVYYTHKYGIIAYELADGEKVEIEEKYLQVQ